MAQLFKIIVNLEVGEGLLFCPTALIAVGKGMELQKLGTDHVRIHVRKRLTADGGRSLMAN